MSQYFWGAPVRRLDGDFSSRWPRPLQGGTLESATRDLHRAVSRLLLGWPLEDVEIAAWEFAIDGWQRPPPLIEDYDAAFQLYLVLVEYRRTANSDTSGITALGLVMEEFRNRVQFLQTRAGDIRLSTQFDRLLTVGLERLHPALETLARQLEREPAAAVQKLDDFGKTAQGELLQAVARSIGAQNPTAGVLVASLEPVLSTLRRIIAAIPDGIAGNAAYDAIKTLVANS